MVKIYNEPSVWRHVSEFSEKNSLCTGNKTMYVDFNQVMEHVMKWYMDTLKSMREFSFAYKETVVIKKLLNKRPLVNLSSDEIDALHSCFSYLCTCIKNNFILCKSIDCKVLYAFARAAYRDLCSFLKDSSLTKGKLVVDDRGCFRYKGHLFMLTVNKTIDEEDTDLVQCWEDTDERFIQVPGAYYYGALWSDMVVEDLVLEAIDKYLEAR